MYDIIIYLLKNLLVMFGVIILVTVFHEMGHYLILKAAGAKPIIKISFKKGSTTRGYIPKDRYTLIQAISAYNAIIYGWFAIMVFMLLGVAFNEAMTYAPATFGVITTYFIGIRQDVKNIKKRYNEVTNDKKNIDRDTEKRAY